MQYTSDQFMPNEAWLIFRLNSFIRVKDKPADIYMLIDLASAYVFGHLVVTSELPDLMDIHRLMKDAYTFKKAWPELFFCASNDPAENLFRKYSTGKNIAFKVEPLSSFNEIINPIKQSFMQFQQSGEYEDSSISEEDQEAVQASIPDSYDLCPCASGLKYKFCCKPVFKEIIQAMSYAEEGRYRDALLWMEKAKKKVGETAEILCRYAIVYSYYNKAKSDEYLDKALKSFPNHPRANYIKGINLKSKSDYEGAIKSYKTAINYYPPTDRFHLNEVWNNLGSAYFSMKRYSDAKAAWEKALEYLPRDNMTRKNLKYMIYENPDVPDDIKKGSSIYLLDSSDTRH